jgi:hypothetical protein
MLKSITHYKSISLKNFRGFRKKECIPLAPLTFLVGPNSSGKSSIFDALLFIAQSGFNIANPRSLIPNWTGSLVDLGSFHDTVYNHNTDLSLGISIEISSDLKGHPAKKSPIRPLQLEYNLRCTKSDPAGHITSFRIMDHLSGASITLHFKYGKKINITLIFLGRKRIYEVPREAIFPEMESVMSWIEKEINTALTQQPNKIHGNKAGWNRLINLLTSYRFLLFSRGIERVSSGRAAPSRWYPTEKFRWLPYRRVEPKVFDAVNPTAIEAIKFDEKQKLHKRKKIGHRKTIDGVLKSLNIANTISDFELSPYHSAIQVRDNVTNIKCNLIDVGYGASQVIPVILGCLSDSVSPLFVEQPEIHLHPSAQGTLAELLCMTSNYRQVIIETHSEHMINRARLLIASGDIHANDVVINYVSRSKKGSEIYTIPILANGDFEVPWPEGFFDERYHDTMTLLQLKAEKEKG